MKRSYRYDIEERVVREAEWYLHNQSTIRDVAKKFRISKSTVYVDLSKRLPYIDHSLYSDVRRLLLYNKEHCTERATEASLVNRRRSY